MSYPGGPPRGTPPMYSAPPNMGYAPPPSGQPPAAVPGGGAPAMYRPPTGAPQFMNPSGGPAAPPPANAPGYALPSTPAAPPASYGGYAPPPTSAPGGYPAAPSTAGYGGPPTGYSAPPAGPPMTGPPTGYPSAGNMAPSSTNAPRPMFFTPGGAPSAPPSGYGGPPTTVAGPTPGYGGPPTGPPVSTGPLTMPPPPTGAPLSMPPPPSGGPSFMAPPGGVPGGPPGYGAAVSPAVPPQYAINYGASVAPPPSSMVGMPTGFDSGNNLASLSVNTPGVPGNPAVPGSVPGAGDALGSGAAPLPGIEEIDMSITCNPNFLRASVTKIVASQQLATNSRVPLGVVVKPMAGDKGITNDEVEVVDFGATGIVRCKRCRTYINPFVSWTDNGRRWRCNICGMLNDVPSTYFSHLDGKGQRRDKDTRPELSRCSVEFVAPGDYMVRPPQPPVYFFVIDVSEQSVLSGMLTSMVNAIRASLDHLPGSPRTQIGFITFDSQIHFYNLKASLSAPQMLVISDINDPIMPLPEDLLVNLQDSRKVVDALLDTLPTMFHKHLQTPQGQQQQQQMGMAPCNTCTGAALMAAKRVIQHVGGKLCLFQSSLPNLGEGALKMRENPRLLGTDKEHTMLVPEDPWYKTQAIDFSRLQIAVDTFLFASQYTDVATISALSKYTSGECFYYPAFHAPRDGAKFEQELTHDLTRATAFEAVMRVRATRGLRFSNFYGNYFVRGTDLLALPNCSSDSTFALDLAYDEPHLTASVVTIQAALLYTNSSGERRIRVHTMVLPVTQSLPEMIEGVDIDCAMNLLSKQAVDIACKTGLDNARQRVHTLTVEMLRAARAAVVVNTGGHHPSLMPNQQHPGTAIGAYANGSTTPNSLVLLPLYAMSLQKSLALRGGTDVRVDERAYFQLLLNNMDIEESKVFIYPRLFSISEMGHEAGIPCDPSVPSSDAGAGVGSVRVDADGNPIATAGPFSVRLPHILNLSYERLTTSAIVLLENGHDMFMWIGRGVNPAILSTLFGMQSLDGVQDVSKLAILPDNSDFSSRVHAVVTALRAERTRYMQLHFIREGDGFAEAYFARFLIEDRANFSGGGLSYTEYHSHVTRAVG